MRVVGNRVLIEKILPKKETETGIILAKNDNFKPNIGVIIQLGTEFQDKNFEIGNKVIFDKHKGTEITIEEKELFIFDYNDLIGVIKE